MGYPERCFRIVGVVYVRGADNSRCRIIKPAMRILLTGSSVNFLIKRSGWPKRKLQVDKNFFIMPFHANVNNYCCNLLTLSTVSRF
jgi:hypothetical protein